MKFFENLMNFLKFKESEDYDFVLPDADASQDSQTTNNSPELDPLKNVNEIDCIINLKIFFCFFYIETKY